MDLISTSYQIHTKISVPIYIVGLNVKAYNKSFRINKSFRRIYSISIMTLCIGKDFLNANQKMLAIGTPGWLSR